MDRVMNDRQKRPDVPEESAMSGKIDFDEIRKVIALLEEKNLAEFELEIEGLKIRISRSAPPAAPASASAPSAPGPSFSPAIESASAQGTPAAASDKNLQIILSPMVGTFYRAPDPTAPPFVDIGDPVKKGQTLCIIEAMKLMNEIESDIDGTVVEIFPENAKPVEYGQKLFAIKPLS